jgi:hypothetical protein
MRLRLLLLLLTVAAVVTLAWSRAESESIGASLTPAQKARAWVYVQGYKGYPRNYCQVIVTHEDNGVICNRYRTYDLANDKDRAQKWYVCKPTWDCESVPNENAR